MKGPRVVFSKDEHGFLPIQTFAGASDPEQHLVLLLSLDPVDELLDGLGLVPLRFIR